MSTLVSPEGGDSQTVVLLNRKFDSEQRTEMVEYEAVPIIHLSLGGVDIVCKRIVLFKKLADATDCGSWIVWADSVAELFSCHLLGVVWSAVPLGRFPLISRDPQSTSWVMSDLLSFVDLTDG